MAGKLYVITGTDAAQIAARGRALVRELAGPAADAFSLDVVSEGDEVSAQAALGQFVQSILTPAFMAGEKTVWLKNFSAFKEEKKKGSPGPLAGIMDRLTEVVENGIPEGIVAVMTGPDMDKRKRLYKICSKVGTVEIYDKPDIKSRDWQREMACLIRESATAKGLRLAPEALDHLIAVLGTETGGVDAQMEKLRCYLGEEGTVTGEIAQLLCHGDGETVFWAVTDAIGQRDLNRTFKEIEAVLAQEKNPDGAVLGLVRQVASYFRQLLQVKLLMVKMKISSRQINGALKNISPERKALFLGNGLEVAGMHPYRCQMLGEQAERFGGVELVDAVVAVRDVYWHCVSSGGGNRSALESMLAKTVSSQ